MGVVMIGVGYNPTPNVMIEGIKSVAAHKRVLEHQPTCNYCDCYYDGSCKYAPECINSYCKWTFIEKKDDYKID
jgi:hypothetical protein